MWKWRVLLPTMLGLVSAALLRWQARNSRIILSMGMAWDTGAPLWPYQTPEILLVILNAPAYLIAAPITMLFGLRTLEEKAPALLVSPVLLWFCVGRLLDCNVTIEAWLHARKMMLPVLTVIALMCVAVAARLTIDGVIWWSTYGHMSLSSLLTLARVIGPLPWCAGVASLVTVVVVRTLRASD